MDVPLFAFLQDSISLTPAPDLLDKPQQPACLSVQMIGIIVQTLTSAGKLYSPHCLTRQGFPHATSTNIDFYSIIPQCPALS